MIEVHSSQVAGAVAFGFVVEVRRRWMTTFTARGYRACADSVAEFHDRNEAIAVGAIPFFCSGVSVGTERRERAPQRGCEPYGYAGLGIVERLHYVSRQALESIDVAPWSSPASKVSRESIRRYRQSLKLLVRRGLICHVFFR